MKFKTAMLINVLTIFIAIGAAYFATVYEPEKSCVVIPGQTWNTFASDEVIVLSTSLESGGIVFVEYKSIHDSWSGTASINQDKFCHMSTIIK